MAKGGEPHASQWKLEQQRAELPFGEPEQQLPFEQQQQQRLSCLLPVLSPMGARLIGSSSHQFLAKAGTNSESGFRRQ